MDIDSLNDLVQKWFKEQPILPHGVVMTVTISPKHAIVGISTSLTLSKILNDKRSEADKTNVYTNMEGVLRHEFSNHNIDWYQATLQDFIKVFPNQRTFVWTPFLGKCGCEIMHAILKENGYDWT